jgi:23S rRNA pseudouridine955/2504/2580 synthase
MKHLQAKVQAVRQPITVDEAARPQVVLHTICAEEAGQRLDHYLVRVCKGVPKSHLYRVIRSGEVRINGKRAQGDNRLNPLDVVRVPPIWLDKPIADVSSQALPTAKGRDFPVLFEDDFLLAIDKPEKVAVHGGSGVSSGVVEQLRASRPELRYLELVHRIDKDTSGLLLLAKRRSALVHLQEQFRTRTIGKHYRAVVLGKVPKRTKTLDGNLLIKVTAEGQKQVLVRTDGVTAVTRVLGLEHYEHPQAGTLTLIDAKIETGRTHQIRVHVSHEGWPIVGDEKYGDFELNKLLSKILAKRMFLHAFSIDFYHPEPSATPKGRIYLEAPLPLSFKALFPA